MKRLLIVCTIVMVIPCTDYATPIPDTGQTKCYNNTQEITCPNPGEDFYGQDAQYGPNLQSYTKLDANSNNLPDDAPTWAMVRDNVTGLIWEVKTDDGSIHDRDNIYTWHTAQEVFVEALNSAQFGGYDDWRLPTIQELAALVNRSAYDPSVNTTYFPNTVSSRYWSSTSLAFWPDSIAIVDFSDGKVDIEFEPMQDYAWAVRTEKHGSVGTFIDDSEGTVTDTHTGLMWQKDTAPSHYTWQQALTYCENLTLAGYADWRLPSATELHSLVDYSFNYPSINITYFPNTAYFNYWSSTPYAPDPTSAWIISFAEGFMSGYNKTYGPDYVRAVRGGLCGVLGDSDGDTVCDNVDNCIDNFNPFQIDCDTDGIGDICDTDPIIVDPDDDGVDIACDNCLTTSNPNQLDTYPTSGNGIGDACECEGNFNCSEDQDVDGSDAALFKGDFGRSTMVHPCLAGDTCNGDFDCDRDVDGTDASLFKSDFGRSSMQNPCPMCGGGVEWCTY